MLIAPSWPPVLNRADPLTRGLVFCAVGGWPVDLVTGRTATYGGTKATALGGKTVKWGRAFESTVTNGTGWMAFPDAFVASKITTQHTIVVIADLDGTSGFGKPLCIPYTASAWSSPFMTVTFAMASASASPACEYSVGGSQTSWQPGGTYWTTGLHVYGWNRDGSAHTLYKDGASFTSASFGSSGALDFSGTATSITLMGRSDTSTGESQDGRYPLIAMWNRPLTGSEHMVLDATPWRLFTLPDTFAPMLGLLDTGTPGYAGTGRRRIRPRPLRTVGHPAYLS